jgi:hypothetical protein
VARGPRVGRGRPRSTSLAPSLEVQVAKLYRGAGRRTTCYCTMMRIGREARPDAVVWADRLPPLPRPPPRERTVTGPVPERRRSVRPSTAASQHYDSSPAMTTGRTSRTRPSSHREDVLPPPPPPSLPTSTSMYQLRNAPPVRERAATALDTTEARDREQRRWGYSVSPMGGEEAGRTRRTPLSSADRASRDMLFGARRRGGAEQQDSYSSSPNHAGRAATSLGTASLTRRQRDRHLDIHSLSDDDNDKRDGDHFEPRSVIRAGTSLGTPDRSRRHNGRDELSDREMRRRQVNGSEQFSGAAAGRTMDDMLDDESELERTPRSGKKTSGGGTAIPSTGSRDNG